MDTPETAHTPEDDWLSPPNRPAADEPAQAPRPPRSRRALGKAAALVVAGVLAGGAATVAITHDNDSANAAQSNLPAASAGTGLPGTTNGGPQVGPPGSSGLGGGSGGGFGGLAGEQHIEGTLTAVGSSTVTVRSSSGTATYQVDSATQVVRDGAAVALSQLRVGDAVLVHVYPASSGGDMLVERIFAGTLPAQGGQLGDDGGTASNT